MIINKLRIKKIKEREQLPIELLLLADPSLDQIEKYINVSEVYIVIIDSSQVACYVLTPFNDNTLELMNIAVHKDFQKQGIGTYLLNDAIYRARLKGFKSLIIGTGNSSLEQLHLYQKIGFKIDHLIKDYFLHNYKDPIWEYGILCKDKIMLTMDLTSGETTGTNNSSDFHLEILKSKHIEKVKILVAKHWGSPLIITKGQIHNISKLDGFVSLKDGCMIGLITYKVSNNECEIITLDSLVERQGLGTLLVNKVIAISIQKKYNRVWLISTNDNTNAIRFYQKLGFRWTGFYKDAVNDSRIIKPDIPELGFDRIPIEHEIEFEYLIDKLVAQKTRSSHIIPAM